MKFSEVYSEYLLFIENKQKLQSKETLKVRFENRILPFWKDYDIYKIKDIDYIKWQNEIEKENFSNNYKRGLHYLLSGLFEYCIKYHNLNYNFSKKVGMFKLKNEKLEHDFYTLREFKLFINNVNDNIYKQFFNLMFYTGTRPGEAMALRFSDLDKRLISINKEITEHSYNGKRVVDDPKSLTSFRQVSIDRKLNKDLLKLKEYYNKEFNLKDYDYYIFGGVKPLAPTTINRHKIKACNKAHLRPIKLHEFRHSHASLLYDKNIPIQMIKERLGHANIDTTMNVYVHLVKGKEKRVQRTLNFLRLF